MAAVLAILEGGTMSEGRFSGLQNGHSYCDKHILLFSLPVLLQMPSKRSDRFAQ